MKTRLVKLILPFILISLACNLLGSQPEQEDLINELPTKTSNTDPTITGESQEMNCEEMGLPCTPSEVDPEALERSAEIYQELINRFEEGESIETLREWLEESDEIRIVLSNEVSVMFILEGGLPTGIYDAALAGGRGEPDTNAASGSKVLASTLPPFIPKGDVVGEGTSRENDNRHKHALILSPFEFEFTIPDAGADSKNILGKIPDYKGRVKYLKNDEVIVDTFKEWNNYDLIMYNGHGGIITGTDSKTGKPIKSSFITTGDEQINCKLQNLLQGTGVAEFPSGVGCTGVKVRVENMFGRAEDTFIGYLTIYPFFFNSTYKEGLEKSVVIFNGCMSFVTDALPARLAGKDSVFFGWDNDVLSHFSPDIMNDLFTELAAGNTSENAYDEVCDSGGCIDTKGKGAKLIRYAGGDDLRIREIAISLHPLSGEPLTDGDKVPVYGYPNDGQVDELPFYIEVIGVELDMIPLYMIRFEVNGQPISGVWKLDDPEAVEKWESPGRNTYRILDRMVLPFDFQQDQEFNVVILVDLPEGGKSKSVKVEPLIRNPVLGFVSYFGSEQKGTKLNSYVSAEVPLSLEEIKDDLVTFQSMDQPDLLKYDSFELTVPDCETEPQTTDGSIDVFSAVFPKNGFTNIGIPKPVEFRFMPTEAIAEGISMTCAGTTTSLPYPFWHVTFITVNEKRHTAQGIEINNWSEGSEDVYAQFHWESEIKDLKGEYTLQIREP